jgi:hypothetical protein
MSSMLKKSAALAALFVVVFGGGIARANTIEVKVPFPFLVRGHMMPAGQYLIEHEGTNIVLIRGEKETRAAAFVVTIPASGRDPAGDRPTLTFTHHETERQLSGIWDSETDGRAVINR